MRHLLVEGGVTLLPDPDGAGKIWEVILIKAGKSANKNYYPTEVIKKAQHLFEGVRALARSDENHVQDREHHVRDIVGWFDRVRFKDDALVADFHISEAADWLRVLIKDAWKQGCPHIVGFSLVAEGRGSLKKIDGEVVRCIEAIDKVNSVDVVVNPAAGGKVLKLVAGDVSKLKERKNMSQLLTLLEEQAPQLLEGLDKEKLTEGEVAGMVGDLLEKSRQWEKKLHMSESNIMLSTSLAQADLPKPLAHRVEQHFENRSFTQTDLSSFIQQERELYAQLTESGKVSGMGATKYELGASEQDKTITALDGFFAGQDLKGIERFRSFREAYITITGDKHITGQLTQASNLQKYTEALQTSSWSSILGDSITRQMQKEYNSSDVSGWKKIVSDINPISTFRTNRRMRMGGYGSLPAVAESADYASLTSPGDEEATYAISKRGGLETITLEMTANDDVGAIRRIPKKLGRLAAVTIYRFVLDMIKNNIIATYDAIPLFHANHNNLGTAALSATSLLAAKVAMSQQAAYGNAADIMGLDPKYLLVPLDLQDTAYRLTASQGVVGSTGEAGVEPNIHASYGLEILVVPYWTDSNDWALVCNTQASPTIEVGFFNGEEDPELFVQDQPTVGSLFSADKITYKIRHIYGGTVLDHRGMYKAVVA